jgi:hypothetical protein
MRQVARVSLLLLLLLVCGTAALDTAPLTLERLEFAPETGKPFLVRAFAPATVELRVRVCATLPLSLAQLRASIVRDRASVTNPGNAHGVFTSEESALSPLTVRRPAVFLRGVVAGSVSSRPTPHGMSAERLARLQLEAEEVLPVEGARTTSTVSSVTLCSVLPLVVQVRQLQRGAWSFGLCATWQQPLWTTACLDVPALQLDASGTLGGTAFPWPILNRVFPTTGLAFDAYVDRCSTAPADPPAQPEPLMATVHFDVVQVVQVTAQIVEEIVVDLVAYEGNHYNVTVNETNAVTGTRRLVTHHVHTVRVPCVPAGALAVVVGVRRLSGPTTVVRSRCRGQFNLSAVVLALPNSTETARLVFPMPSPVTNLTVLASTATLEPYAAHYTLCTMLAECAVATAFTVATPGALRLPAMAAGLAVAWRSPTGNWQTPALFLPVPLLTLAGAAGAKQNPASVGSSAGVALLASDGELLLYCSEEGHQDGRQTRRTATSTYVFAFTHGRGTRACGTLPLSMVWNQRVTVERDVVVPMQMGPWLRFTPVTATPLVTTATNHTGMAFTTITECTPATFRLTGPVDLACMAALPARHGTVSHGNATTDWYAPPVLEAVVLHTHSGTVMTTAAIRDVRTRDTGDGTTLLFFTARFSPLGEFAVSDRICVLPLNLPPGGMRFQRDPVGAASDSTAVCQAAHVRFTYTPGVHEARPDELTVLPSRMALHGTVNASEVLVPVDPRPRLAPPARRRHLLQVATLTFSTAFVTMQLGSGATPTSQTSGQTTLQCVGHPPVTVAVVQTLSASGHNRADFTVDSTLLPPNGTLVCTGTLSRLGYGPLDTVVATERSLFRHYKMTADGVTFEATASATQVSVQVTFAALGSKIVHPPTPLARFKTQLASFRSVVDMVFVGVYAAAILVVGVVYTFT